MYGKWKWTTVPLMLALVTTPLALGGQSPGEATDLLVEEVPEHETVPVVDDSLEGRERLLAVVEQVGAWQTSKLAEERVYSTGEDTMGAHEALSVLAKRHGVELSVTDSLALRLLDDELDPALASVVTAFLALEDEALVAFGAIDLEAARDDPWSQADDVRLSHVIAAQERLLEASVDLQEALEATQVDLPVLMEFPGAFSLRLGECDDQVYTQDTPLIIDECGNDVYRNNAGGASLNAGLSDWCNGQLPLAAAAVIDLDGDDEYLSARNCGGNGGGYAGAGFLYDAAGHDDYIAGVTEETWEGTGNDGTNGGAVLGAGFLVDRSGDDRYIAGGWGTNGGAYPGARAILVDMDGDDVYRGSFEAVNGGGLAGAGALWDDGGDDAYDAWSTGINGGAIAGAGLLYDRAGHDFYKDDVVGQGMDMTEIPKETNGIQLDDDA